MVNDTNLPAITTYHYILPLLIVGLFSLLTYAVFTKAPLEHEERPVTEFDASSPPLVLSVTETTSHRFIAPGEKITGVAIYAQAAPPGTLKLTLTNEANRDSVSSTIAATTVQGNTTKITMPVSGLQTKIKDPILLEITRLQGRPLPLATNQAGILTFSLRIPLPTSFGAQQGALAGIVVLLALLATQLFPQLRLTIVVLLLCLLPLVAVGGFWFSDEAWGVADWDYRFSLHEIYRRTILVFHEFPFWNPYTCGGAAGLADPEFSVFSGTFFLELLFGIPRGTKAAIYAGIVVMSVGTFTLARHLRLSWQAATLAAIITTYSSAFILKIVEGHVTIVYAYMWVPLIFWSWLNAYATASAKPARYNPWNLLCGVLLTLTFFQGGVYILSYTLGALLILVLLVKHPRRAARVTITSGLWFAGLSSIKLLPVIAWLYHFPDDFFVPSTHTLTYLSDIFLRRHQHGSFILPAQQSGWHEYGAYVGYGVLALGLISLSQLRRSHLVRPLFIAVLASIVVASTGPWLITVFDIIPFIPRSNISRVALFTVLSGALLAGIGLDVLRRRFPSRSMIPLMIISFIAIDLLSLSYSISEQAFIIPPRVPAVSPAPKPLAYTEATDTVRRAGHDHNRAYASTLAGYGTFTFCSVLGPQASVATIQNNDIPPTVYRKHDNQAMNITQWSPNQLTVAGPVSADSTVIVNMNYAPGWLANKQPAHSESGRLATTVKQNEDSIVFTYHPPLLKTGLIISLGTSLTALAMLHHRRRHKAL
ncbi:MAG: hypothetical protein WEA04_00510 [Candidatus Andersenbacteria bacterium]